MPLTNWHDRCQDHSNPLENLKNFETYAIQILGEQEFIHLASFWVDIIQKTLNFGEEPYLVAVITRRCGILFHIFLEYFKECQELGEVLITQSENCAEDRPFLDALKKVDLGEFEKRCVTDTNIMSLSTEIVSYYHKYQKHINVIVVDELLIHGRALNLFLTDLEKRVLQQLDMESEQGSQQFLEHLLLFVYAQSRDVLLLLVRYRECLYTRKLLERQAWRDLSARFARLVAVSPVNNACYAWSICAPVEEGTRYPVYQKQYGEFRYYLTGLHSTREENFIFLYPNATCVKAIGTVRSKRSIIPFCSGEHAGKCSQMYVPYMIFDHLSLENILRLHNRIVEDAEQNSRASFCGLFKRNDVFAQKIRETPGKYYRWLAETNELILGYLLFCRFAKRVFAWSDAQIEQYGQYVDMEVLSWDYKWLESVGNGSLQVHDVKEDLKNIWKWHPADSLLEEYLELLLEDIPPIWDGAVFGDVKNWKAEENELCGKEQDHSIAIAVQDAISQIGFSTEKTAYERFNSGAMFNDKMLSYWGEYYSIRDFLLECKKIFDEYGKYYTRTPAAADLYQVMAVVVQAMDLGLIGMNPLYGQISHETNGESQFYTMLKAGEQALFIWPTRYQKFIPTLMEMSEKWGGKLGEIRIDLARFSRAYVENMGEIEQQKVETEAVHLFSQLWRFLNTLHESGLTLREWTFRMYRTQGLDTKEPQDYDSPICNSEVMMEDWMAQRRSLNIYRMT